MTSAITDDIRDAINPSSADFPDAKALKTLKCAEVTLELNKEIDKESCKNGENC